MNLDHWNINIIRPIINVELCQWNDLIFFETKKLDNITSKNIPVIIRYIPGEIVQKLRVIYELSTKARVDEPSKINGSDEIKNLKLILIFRYLNNKNSTYSAPMAIKA